MRKETYKIVRIKQKTEACLLSKTVSESLSFRCPAVSSKSLLYCYHPRAELLMWANHDWSEVTRTPHAWRAHSTQDLAYTLSTRTMSMTLWNTR